MMVFHEILSLSSISWKTLGALMMAPHLAYILARKEQLPYIDINALHTMVFTAYPVFDTNPMNLPCEGQPVGGHVGASVK
jgi:hypothetical protein